MDKEYIFCTKCGSKNPLQNKFCVKCGTRLAHASNFEGKANTQKQFNSELINNNGSTSQNHNNTWIWAVVSVVIVIILGVIGYQKHQERQRSDIRSYVYDELSKSEFKVKIDQDEQSVVIVPYSTDAKYAMRYIANVDADGEDADDMDDSIEEISKKIEDNEGDGWTVSLQNPDNDKRFFWIYKDGKAKYRLQDHTVSYDSMDDYGDEYDFDEDDY